MGLFDGIGDTELFESGVYLTPGGIYELEVQKVLAKKTRKSGIGFIVEFKILSVEGSEAEAKHAVGSKATWFQKMTDEEVAFPAITEFMVALMEVDWNNPEEKEEFMSGLQTLLSEVCWEGEDSNQAADKHPLHGQRVRVETYTKLTQKNLEFTVHKWSVSEYEEAA